MNKHILWLLLLSYSLWTSAQSLSITQSFRAIPNSSVLASYKNQFGSWKQKDDFPYAVVRVVLEGNANEVMAAKQLLHLHLGDSRTEISVYKGMQNELLFLVPTSAKQIDITCGADCMMQRIIDSPTLLQNNTVYVGHIQYVLNQVKNTPKTVASNTMRQFFIFRLTPANAHVTVNVNGINEGWEVEEGIAYKLLQYGSYPYTIEADGFYPQNGVIEVSEESREMTVVLHPIRID